VTVDRAPEGYLIVDKPPGMTSHDVVSRVRRAIGSRRVGHGGTLDPDAVGVLVVAVGPATRLLRYISGLDKSYVGEVVLGVATSTLDAAGEVTGEFDMSGVTLAEVRAAAARLTGPIEQIPPMVSAVRVGGKRLYELAREGKEVERAARHVVVERFEVDEGPEPGVVRIAVDCSSGTFVRALAADLGGALGGGAHLRNLVRERVGPFERAGAVALDTVALDQLLPAGGLVAHLTRLEVGEERERAIGNGQVLERRSVGAAGRPPWAVFSAGNLLAVYEALGEERMKPELVYRTAPGIARAVENEGAQ
jgi:tRNA pseudouridine55 synthase